MTKAQAQKLLAERGLDWDLGALEVPPGVCAFYELLAAAYTPVQGAKKRSRRRGRPALRIPQGAGLGVLR